jgi:hypothetical protein
MTKTAGASTFQYCSFTMDLSRFDAASLIAFTATKETDYMTETDEFRKDSVRIALTSGLKRKQVADDLGVGRLMRQNGISVIRTRKHKVTTDSNHRFNVAPNLLDRNFIADQPNQKLAGDFTYI